MAPAYRITVSGPNGQGRIIAEVSLNKPRLSWSEACDWYRQAVREWAEYASGRDGCSRWPLTYRVERLVDA